jgi:hypothetical protein
VLTRFRKQARMPNDNDPGDALEDVAQIHPALDRLRQLVTSATILDLMATSDSYWTDQQPQDDSGRDTS